MEFLALLVILVITPLGLMWFVAAHSWSRYQYRVLLNPVNFWYIPAALAILGGFSALNRNETSSDAPAVQESAVVEEEPVAAPQIVTEPPRRTFESYQEQREREALEALSDGSGKPQAAEPSTGDAIQTSEDEAVQ